MKDIPIEWIAGIVGTLATAVAVLWYASDSRAAKYLERESARVDRYETERAKAMEAAKDVAVLLAQVAKQQIEADTRCRDGLSRVEKRLEDVIAVVRK